MYVDSLGPIAVGREISAFPKKSGSARLHLDADTLAGTLDCRSLRVATATTGFERALVPLADLPVREIVSASHILYDLTLGRPSVVHDYLAST